MSMTYCSCRRCGEPLLLDDKIIATRGYICDDCFNSESWDGLVPVHTGCPHCGFDCWMRTKDGTFLCLHCRSEVKLEDMKPIIVLNKKGAIR